MLSSSQIRASFIDFFTHKHGHAFVPSSPVVPHGDPTLLFANAGMNQFKPYFLGTERPSHTRVANSQKCIRAGGKHNDLDDVGKDSYHHTFFEMLGNWSFGDYFKQGAIEFAWELLTQVWGIDPKRLHVTVFEGDEKAGIPRDDEAAEIWRACGVPPERIHLGNKKDNFWEMGSTGPCGPCTEIHYDSTPDYSGGPLVNGSSDLVVEIWNLVFIQFNRNEDQSLTPLPARHVDTGMGFERVTKVLQGKRSNYDTDIFAPIIQGIAELTGRTYGGSFSDATDTGFRVIADHLRMATVAITDGARPGAKGRESVVRSVIRRAVRYGYLQFERRSPFIHTLVPIVAEQMGGAFPELLRDPRGVAKIIESEERAFFGTIGGGLRRFESAVAGMTGTFDGETAARLSTTYGFPADMTAQMAGELGLAFDQAGYDAAVAEHGTRSKGGKAGFVVAAIKGELPPTDDGAKFDPAPLAAKVLGYVSGNEVVRAGRVPLGEPVALLLDRTNFYAEQGGQVGDSGAVTGESGAAFAVEDAKRLGASVLHVGELTGGELAVGDAVTATTDPRAATERNHTATHLLNLALRRVLGDGVAQKGSLVDADRTRFDFSHDAPLSPEQLREVESLVRREVESAHDVTATVVPLAEAKLLPNVQAVFGEKYPDPVRVVSAGESVEFCGGTHVGNTREIGAFRITSQEGVAKGVRRVTAVTGAAATEALRQLAGVAEDLAARLQCPPEQLPARVAAMQDELKRVQAQLKKSQVADLTQTVDKLLADSPSFGGSRLIVAELPGATVDLARQQLDRVRQLSPSALMVFAWAEADGKVPVIAALTPDLVKRGLKAGEIVKQLAQVLGGSGGGKPDLAQAGGKDAAKLPDALAKARELGASLLGG